MSRDVTDRTETGASPQPGIDAWRERVAKELGEAPIESLTRQTPDGLTLQPIYTAADRPEAPGQGAPGLGPSRWGAAGSPRLCTLIETSDLLEAGQYARLDLEGGSSGLFLRLDGVARGVADGPGLPLHHGADVAALLGSVDLAGRELWIDPGANALPCAALYLAASAGTETGNPEVTVHYGGDPMGTLARDGRLPRDLMKLSSELAALMRFVARRMPGSTAMTLSTLPFQQAGATREQELAILVSALWESVRVLAESGLEAADVARGVSLRLAVGTRIFPEIAKLRAARLLWRATLGAAGVDGPPAARIHAVGSLRSLSSREPPLNVLRSTEQAFVASCGGADAVSLRGFDRTLGDASGPLARRLARNTPLILDAEGRLGRVEDPAAGSFYVESLTRQLADRAWVLAQEIEAEGGLTEALVSGRLGERIAAAAKRRQQVFESGEAGITGVTHYIGETEKNVGAAEAPAIDGGPVDAVDERRAAWSGQGPSSPTFSQDFVVEELVAAARGGETVDEIGARLGGDEGAERCDALPLRRDAARFEEDA